LLKDSVEHGEPAGNDQTHFRAKFSWQFVYKRCPGLQEPPSPRNLELHQIGKRLIITPMTQVKLAVPETYPIFLRQINTSPLKISMDILPEIHKLQACTDGIGLWQTFGGSLVE
jgi:hypothetical protein